MTKTRSIRFSKRRGGRKTVKRRGGRRRSRVTKRGGKRRSRVTKRRGGRRRSRVRRGGRRPDERTAVDVANWLTGAPAALAHFWGTSVPQVFAK